MNVCVSEPSYWGTAQNFWEHSFMTKKQVLNSECMYVLQGQKVLKNGKMRKNVSGRRNIFVLTAQGLYLVWNRHREVTHLFASIFDTSLYFHSLSFIMLGHVAISVSIILRVLSYTWYKDMPSTTQVSNIWENISVLVLKVGVVSCNLSALLSWGSGKR